MSYYGNGGSSSTRKTYKSPTRTGNLSIGSSGGGYGGGGGGGGADAEDTGKGSIDLFDIPGSVADTAGSYAGFAGGIVGGVAGAVGSVGFGDGKNLGAIADVPGALGEAVGGIELPRIRGVAGNDEAPAATIGDIPGAMLDVVGAPGKALERTIAGQRVTGGPLAGLDVKTFLPGGAALSFLDKARTELTGVDNDALPPDLQQRLEAGESVDVIADELVARGAGYSNDPLENLASQIVLDPLNLIAPGASKVGQGIKAAATATRVPTEYAKMGLSARAAGLAYSAASRGMSQAGGAFMDKVVGPVTSGALHALGTKSYSRMLTGYGKLSPDYAARLEDAGAVANANLAHAVIGDELADDIMSGLAKAGDDLDGQVAQRLTAKRGYAGEELQRRAQEKLAATSPEFLGQSQDELDDFTARAMAMATGSSPEDAARIVGRASLEDAKTAHWLRYGRAVDEMAEARETARIAFASLPEGKKPNIDIDRLTLIGDDTLTVERAQALADLPPGPGVVMRDEAMKYRVIANHFLGKNPSDGQIMEFIGKLAKEGALPTAVRMPKSGKNKLPSALSDFRTKWLDNGYDLGFAPKDDVRIIKDDDGNVVNVLPFIRQTTARDGLTMRNPLGRFMDGLTRGITQTTIVNESRQRMTRHIADAGLPIAPNQVRSIHKAILEEAYSRSVTPRALAGEKSGGQPVILSIFKRFLADDEYAELTARFDPTYLVMRAFEGNAATVGLTQKFTGKAKSRFPAIARIAEGLYPRARFTYRPTFQLQEMIESPTFNALRGVVNRPVDPELAKAYAAMAEQPEFRYLTEASFLNIAGDRMVQRFMGASDAFGRAMGRFTNIQARKEVARVAQVAHEHGDEFKTAVERIDPRLYSAMREAYGTSDPRVIAESFMKERMRLASGDIDDVMAAIDDVRPTFDGEGGEIVWQAFRDSFRESSMRAFKTHFFNAQRGWLERTLNHPYLGLYPLSYMWGKVLPEFARFLVARPFGQRAPLTGFNAVNRVQQAYLGALQDDPEFNEFIQTNANAIYFANLLFPGNPTNLAVNTPAWARHVSEDLQEGREVGPMTVAREAFDTAGYAFNPVGDVLTAARVNEDIFANLERSAAEFDGMFGATP